MDMGTTGAARRRRTVRTRLATIACWLAALAGVWGFVYTHSAPAKDPALLGAIAAQADTDTAEETTSVAPAAQAQSTRATRSDAMHGR